MPAIDAATERAASVFGASEDGTKIISVETYALSVPLEKPIADSNAALTHWIVPVVEVKTSDGFVGTGISGVHNAPELLCDIVQKYYAPALLGAPADDIVGTWNRMYWQPTHWMGRAGTVHMALAMVDIALWDIAAQRAGMPLWKLLGGSAAPVEAYNTNGGWLNFSDSELVADLLDLVDQGWKRVKIKVGSADWREDVRRVRAVRAAIGDEVTLMCDANQKWDFSTAARILPYLEEARMDWVEEPLHPEDVDGHARLQSLTTLDIAGGEAIYSYQQFSTFMSRNAYRVVQPDVTRLGGITEWRNVATQAGAMGIRMAPHAGDMMQVHQHLVGTVLSEAKPLVEFIPWTREAFLDRSRIEAGMMTRPQVPGASTAIKPEARRNWQIRAVGASQSL
ncbi:mandelate racemase/muconate lactonizing enzyme family protein [Paenarthrobacter sp. NPDC057981]|uniref:mandelate racemase/muconate lactonizing enzyme family protein n=1 Tax=Paenarthrobacter sp. NPDC057981 TaxID=3346297 RepID=UPI0036DF4F75